MPNGGPDNCGTCGFNRRNLGIWRNPSPNENEVSFCQIRSIAFTADHWTYCENWHTRSPQPVGPVYSSGLYENGYRRIPWHGNIEPVHISGGLCSECGQRFADGIQIATVESAAREFCCNLHYLTWWKREHPTDDAPMSNDIWQS